MRFSNWLGKVANPFNLRVPPAGFLRELAAFDADLVLYPSQEQFAYRLARLGRRSGGLQPSMEYGPDSRVCVDYRLVPVTSFGGGITFGPQIFAYLRSCDTWQGGGAKDFIRRVEEADAADTNTRRRDRESENDARAHSMYRTYKRRAGESVVLSDVNRGRGQIRSKHDSRNSNTRTHSGPMPSTASLPSGFVQSASGLVIPSTL